MTQVSKTHILFVDDEPLVLRAIRRELRAYSERFTATFFDKGADAIDFLRANRCDVLVTDMVMPGIDGAALLNHARAHHPDVVRIVLSGHAEFEQSVRSVPFAHQRLLKPWTDDELLRTLTRAASLRALVGDDLVRKCVSQVNSLPSPLQAHARLSELLDDPNVSFSAVAQLVASDMAMSAKLLQLANSVFVGARRPISDLTDAVRTVGLNAMKQYFSNPYLNVFEIFSDGAGEGGDRFDHLGTHATLTAQIATAVARSDALKAPAFISGVLHDIGSLVLLSRIPDIDRKLATEAREKDCARADLERRTLGVTHAEIGGYLLGLWGLPSDVCNAVSRHHDKGAQGSELELTLRVANWLASEHEARREQGIKDYSLLVTDRDEALLHAFGIRDADLARYLRLAESCVSKTTTPLALTAARASTL
jgi:HD-like signal output (HDOD) protein/CheY-like chemotaxis protein